MAEAPKLSQYLEQENSYPHPSDEVELADVQPKDRLDTHQDDERRRQLHSRRSFLRIAGKTAAYSGLVVSGAMEIMRSDTMAGEIVSNSVDMTLEQVAKSQTADGLHRATLFIPGFNVPSGVPAAKALAAEASLHGDVVGLTHGNRFSIDALEAEVSHYISEHDLTSLTLFGSSLGGLISTELASRIKEVDLVIADSSPADPSDARELPQDFMKEVLENISWALDTLNLSGGPGMRTATEFIKRVHDGDKNLLACLKEALSQNYAESCPNPLVLDLYLFMMTHNVQSKKDTLGETAFAYLGANNPARDTVVDQASSVKKYGAICHERAAPFAYVTSRDTAHADVASRGIPYGEMYQDAIHSIKRQQQEKLRKSLGLNTFRILGR